MGKNASTLQKSRQIRDNNKNKTKAKYLTNAVIVGKTPQGAQHRWYSALKVELYETRHVAHTYIQLG